MEMLGHGIDIVAVQRIARMLDAHAQQFQQRCFTQEEIDYACSKRHPAPYFAARFAAKEAVLKALGTGLTGGIAWTDIQIVRLPRGKPTVCLRGQAAQIANQAGITQWHLSISHDGDYATASAIAMGHP